MRNFFLIVAVLIMFFGYFSCQKPGCMGKVGPIVNQERPLGSFNKIILEDNIDVVLIQGDIEKIELSGPENILPNIQTIIRGDTLSISNETECRWLREARENVHARLFYKNFANLEYKGSGNITNEDTLRNTMWINSESGAGNIELTVDNPQTGIIILKENATFTLHGKTEHCVTYTNARGRNIMEDFVSKKMHIVYSGLADMHIHVTEELDATIRYKGNLYCKGNPVITRSDYFSTGRLIQVP